MDNFVDVHRTTVGNRVQICTSLKEEELVFSDKKPREGESIDFEYMMASVKEEPLELPEDTEMKSAEELNCEQADARIKQEKVEESEEGCGKPAGFAIAAVPLTVVPAEEARVTETAESKEMIEAAEILAGGMQTAKEEPVEAETVPEVVKKMKLEEPFRAEKTEEKNAVADRMVTEKSLEEKTRPKEPEAVILIDETTDGSVKVNPRVVKRSEKPEKRMVDGRLVEDGDFPEEDEWYLVGRTMVTAVSTSKGRKLVDNEIVYFKYTKSSSKSNAQWIVRFSTKRSGEVGRLPMEWGKCVVPLVSSGKVKVLGRCVAAPPTLHMMQEVYLYVSFYIHRSIFIALESSTWTLESTTYIDSQTYPLLSLFKLLNLKPFQQAEFTPSEIESRKRGWKIQQDESESAVLHLVKKRTGGVQTSDQDKDEQAFCESTLNKIVGTAEVYDLKEMEAPPTLTCHLKPYQKQALHWMSESEVGMDDEESARTLHPCWAAYNICDERSTSIYLNIFSGEATTQFPAATQITRGGILADAMGLGKTVMTIALLLARPSRGSSVWQNSIPDRPRGGTLIVCPMALLHQWKDELETHSMPGSISVFVHYGGEKMNNSRLISGYDVILTTFGVLSSAYKQEGQNSIFHSVDWFRVVLDEAHTIKSWKSQGAQATFKLSSHFRWCLTGTPLQNNLEDIYSLLCFLHVEPWCNWAWWSKLIHRPYENGDPRALKLMKAILRPLMLRRTKETKDKYGRPILVLPPTDIQLVKCEPSEAERDFYVALFRRSKDQFENLVAQGKVLNNYASILELLLRLRQCCNHPFLVTSQFDTQKYWDLSKLAKRFFEENDDHISEITAPSQASTEEIVEGGLKGQEPECPICLESADDPVFTPCRHRMCRECLLASWRSHTGGPCPLCRAQVTQSSLMTCPSGTKFTVDLEKKWKGSSKISKLLECLETIDMCYSGEKSIVFSQWTTFLDLLEIALKEKKIEFLRFDGKLSQKNREKVLKEFNETSHKRVLLMSLRAGGVGLNLTAASNVFIMDPWWNPAVEEQAIMRIHRIGQKRTVKVRRFIVSDTVEERLLQVQAKKEKMIAGALTDDDVRSARIEELKMLFR